MSRPTKIPLEIRKTEAELIREGLRVKKAVDKSYTQQHLAGLIGREQTIFPQWLAGKTAIPDQTYIEIATHLGFDPVTTRPYLKELYVNLTKTSFSESDGNSIPVVLSNQVPLISSVQAGTWQEIEEYHPFETYQLTNVKVSKHAFALRVVGDSMTNPHGSPSIPQGSIVIVDPEISADSGKIVVAKLTDSQEATIKRLAVDGANRYLMPLNPMYDKITINGNCRIIGVAVQVISDL